MDAHWAQGQDEAILEQAEKAIDLDAAQAECPACGTPFAPTAGRCPGCGLRFG